MPTTKTGVQMRNGKKLRSSIYKWRNIVQALFVRFVLCCHSWTAVCLATYINKNCLNIIGVSFVLFVVETGIILHCKSGLEWNRFCTPFLVYLVTIIPMLWMLRLNPGFLNAYRISTNTTHGANMTTNMADFLPDIYGMFSVQEEVLTDVLQQSMMLVIILCRWLLPRGHIDRNSLSQLLIMYSAISADILDFSEILTEDLVMENTRFRYAVLGIWSWSLLQFTLVVTTSFTFRRQVRKSTINPASGLSVTRNADNSEILSILMVFFMQDGPFLFVRCYAVLKLGMYQYLTIFFSLKNVLALILGLYRLIVICGCVEKKGKGVLSLEDSTPDTQSLDDIPNRPDGVLD